jgi:hypothetical protein
MIVAADIESQEFWISVYKPRYNITEGVMLMLQALNEQEFVKFTEFNDYRVYAFYIGLPYDKINISLNVIA